MWVVQDAVQGVKTVLMVRQYSFKNARIKIIIKIIIFPQDQTRSETWNKLLTVLSRSLHARHPYLIKTGSNLRDVLQRLVVLLEFDVISAWIGGPPVTLLLLSVYNQSSFSVPVHRFAMWSLD